MALDAIMPIDEGLNSDMKFIAIDTSHFKDMDEADKTQILQYFAKYNVETMEATYEELKEKGLYDPETTVLHGVLLRVEKTRISKNRVVIEGSKYRAGNGAVGVKVTVAYKDGKWQATKADMIWIS
ncbi:MAG TPA: hypothetical protein VF260_12940 [Bacilli bacterium]